jgi:hypothetical protein
MPVQLEVLLSGISNGWWGRGHLTESVWAFEVGASHVTVMSSTRIESGMIRHVLLWVLR